MTRDELDAQLRRQASAVSEADARLMALIDALHATLGTARRKLSRSEMFSALLNVLAHQALSIGMSRTELLAHVDAAFSMHEGHQR